MLTAGDEFGRSQQGNNNAYAQDNAISWVDWEGHDKELEEYTAAVAAWRAARAASFTAFPEDGSWQRLDGEAMQVSDWEDAAGDGFRHVSAGRCLTINRAARLVAISDGDNQPAATETD